MNNKQHPLFPITLSGQWYSLEDNQLSENLISWLIDPTSLTQRLSQNSKTFRVELLGQKIQACPELEANKDIKAGQQVLVREVLLYCDDVPHVFARSLLPLASLTGDEQQLAHLGNKSLGQVLFNNPSLIRKNIEIASFDTHSSIAKFLPSLSIKCEQILWGRRSTFMLEDKPLMVAEVFLPNALAYK